MLLLAEAENIVTEKAMEVRRKIKRRWVVIGVAICLIVVIVLIIIGYRFDGTGFNAYIGPQLKPYQQYRPEKTFWDWMQLLIIPFVLAIIALLFNLAMSRNEQNITEQRYRNDLMITEQRYQNDRELAADKEREDLLQAYLDRMSDLLLNDHLRTSHPSDEVRYIARARTLTVLSRLDGGCRSSLLLFLYESELFLIMQLCTTLPQPLAEIVPTSQKSVNRNR